jgi:hypothetical protein
LEEDVREFRDAFFFPELVRGPVLKLAFARFTSSCFSEAIANPSAEAKSRLNAEHAYCHFLGWDQAPSEICEFSMAALNGSGDQFGARSWDQVGMVCTAKGLYRRSIEFRESA